VGDNEGNFNISFGINNKGVVIAWLGDLDALPSPERQYWMHENIQPIGDNKSDFLMHNWRGRRRWLLHRLHSRFGV
jgi:hypothetical protein